MFINGSSSHLNYFQSRKMLLAIEILIEVLHSNELPSSFWRAQRWLTYAFTSLSASTRNFILQTEQNAQTWAFTLEQVKGCKFGQKTNWQIKWHTISGQTAVSFCYWEKSNKITRRSFLNRLENGMPVFVYYSHSAEGDDVTAVF